jgi:hypothetical protein
MKKSQQAIEAYAERALHSLDKVEQVEANEFLYTRIVSRMRHARQLSMRHNKRLMLRLSLALGLLVCINGISFYVLKEQLSFRESQTGSKAFATAYGLDRDTSNY